MTAFSSLFQMNLTVLHQQWVNTGVKDAHGNYIMAFGNPVERKAIAFYPLHKLPHHDPVSSETVDRIMVDFILECPDATVYSKGDQVTLNGKVYLVQGFPFNWGDANPFGWDKTMFGGSVHLEAVG
jgi:hypothetical protein